MENQRKLISAAVTSLLALSLSASASASESENCFGIAKAGQNGCNSNKNQHACAGHAKINSDPKDFVAVPKGSCLKLGGRLQTDKDHIFAPEKS